MVTPLYRSIQVMLTLIHRYSSKAPKQRHWTLLVITTKYKLAQNVHGINEQWRADDSILHYQPLPITRYQVRFYANKYFE